jgi:hypothetical protein
MSIYRNEQLTAVSLLTPAQQSRLLVVMGHASKGPERETRQDRGVEAYIP